MDLTDRIEAFSQLGMVIRQVLEGNVKEANLPLPAVKLNQLIYTIQDHNPWFTPENVKAALTTIAHSLDREKLINWTDRYPALKDKSVSRRIGVTMAGNIPLVGFHDFLSVLISGDHFFGKLSSKDNQLLPQMANILIDIQPVFKDFIDFSDGSFKDVEAMIGTGSDNTARYFEYYFAKYPSIIRKNRNGVAVLDGTEDPSVLFHLGEDIFSYFGLGCRNVSKIHVPAGYDFNKLVTSIQPFKKIIGHRKYFNNYLYNRAIYQVRQISFIDTGFILFREESEISSPPGVVFFQYYNDPVTLKDQLDKNREQIQCIVSNNPLFSKTLLGMAQKPELWDYADNIDTIRFLMNIPESFNMYSRAIPGP